MKAEDTQGIHDQLGMYLLYTHIVCVCVCVCVHVGNLCTSLPPSLPPYLPIPAYLQRFSEKLKAEGEVASWSSVNHDH